MEKRFKIRFIKRFGELSYHSDAYRYVEVKKRMNNKKAVAFLLAASVLMVAVAGVAFAQVNAMPAGAAASHMGTYGVGYTHQHMGASWYAPLQNGFGYMYRMFVGFCRRFW